MLTQSSLSGAEFESRLAGVLFGTALGDALGLACEGLSARQISWRFGRVNKFHLLGNIGFISDDTEQTSLLARSLCKFPSDAEACAADFRGALLGWFLRLPTGIGLATVRACLKILCGLKETGVRSAGNGACMRAAIIGVFFYDNEEKRRVFGSAICRVTHTDPRAIEAALFVAELAAVLCIPGAENRLLEETSRLIEGVGEPHLKAALSNARDLAVGESELQDAAASIKCSGFVLHSVPLALFCLLRYGKGDVLFALSRIIAAGGDTDSNAAILGAWLGAMKGVAELPENLLGNLEPVPFGQSYWRNAASALAKQKAGQAYAVPTYNWLFALVRNLYFLCLVLLHVLLRILLLPVDLLHSIKSSGKAP